MPRRDGTGPDGKGPRTGRRMGKCVPVKGVSLRRYFDRFSKARRFNTKRV